MAAVITRCKSCPEISKLPRVVQTGTCITCSDLNQQLQTVNGKLITANTVISLLSEVLTELTNLGLTPNDSHPLSSKPTPAQATNMLQSTRGLATNETSSSSLEKADSQKCDLKNSRPIPIIIIVCAGGRWSEL
jgi:hypothetical protein